MSNKAKTQESPVINELKRRLEIITQGPVNSIPFEQLMGAALLVLANEKGGKILLNENKEKDIAPSFNPISLVKDFHEKFELGIDRFKDEDMTAEEWELRHARLEEEFQEYLDAASEDNDVELFDAIIDLVYIALGTCYLRGWDFETGFKRVHAANMAKERAESPRSSKYGSTFDIVKPEGWKPPVLDDLVNV